MAKYNEILVGRVNRFLSKWSGIKGGAPSPQLSSDVQPVVLLPTFGVELRYLESWERFALNTFEGAVVGQNTAIRMRNLATSGVIVVVEKLTFTARSTSDVPTVFLDLISGAPALGTTVFMAGFRLDNRSRPNGSISLTSSNNVAGPSVPTGAIIAEGAVPGTIGSFDFIQTDNQELTLLPGDSLTVRSQGPNLVLHVNWVWRERTLEESERIS